MKTRNEQLAEAFLDTGGEVDGLAFTFISPQRFNLLERRKNSLIISSNRDQTEIEALAEILFVLTRSKEDLVKLYLSPLSEWDEQVGLFLMGLPSDKTLASFRDDYLVPAMRGISSAAVESEAEGKPIQPSRTASRSSRKAQAGSVSKSKKLSGTPR